MNKENIEEKGQELAEQFRMLFGDRYRRQRARRRFFLKLLLGGALCLFCVYMVMGQDSGPEPRMNKSASVKISRPESLAKNVVNTANPLSAEKDAMQADILIKKVEKLPPRVNAAAGGQGAGENGAEQSLEFMPASEESAETTPDDNINKENISMAYISPVAAEAQVREMRPKLEKPVFTENDIRIADIRTCLGVEDRIAVYPQKEFSLHKGQKPHVWMDVRSETLPVKVTHVYYCNDRRYCSVPLSIHFPRTRTWSNVTLHYANEIGNWRVDVLSESGITLSQVEFTVVQ